MFVSAKSVFLPWEDAPLKWSLRKGVVWGRIACDHNVVFADFSHVDLKQNLKTKPFTDLISILAKKVALLLLDIFHY